MSRKAERRRQAALDADFGSDDDDGLMQVNKGKAGRRGRSRTATFIARPAAGPAHASSNSRSSSSRHAGPAAHQDTEQQSAQQQPDAASGGSTAVAAVSALAPSTGRGAAAETGIGVETAQFSSLWDAIPPECKALVYSHLSQRDLARAARVSCGFAEDARAQRASVKICDLPRGITPETASSMVQAFAHAGTVRLSRCLASKGEQEPAQHLDFLQMTCYDHAAAMLAAVAAGSGARRSCNGGCGVHTLEICGIAWLVNSHVHQVCCSFHSLRAIKLDRCVGLTDAALKLLSGYTRSTLPDGSACADSDAFDSAWSHNAGAIAPADAGLPEYRPVGLECVSVASCESVGHAGIQHLLHGPVTSHSLVQLNHSRIRGVGVNLNPRGALQRLQAIECRTMCSVAIQLPAGSPLREVNLGCCPHLAKATVSVDGLRSLDLQRCAALTELQLSCSHLRVLRLTLCQKLRVLQLSSADCFRLEEVFLTSCHNLPTTSASAGP